MDSRHFYLPTQKLNRHRQQLYVHNVEKEHFYTDDFHILAMERQSTSTSLINIVTDAFSYSKLPSNTNADTKSYRYLKCEYPWVFAPYSLLRCNILQRNKFYHQRQQRHGWLFAGRLQDVQPTASLRVVTKHCNKKIRNLYLSNELILLPGLFSGKWRWP